MKSLKPKPTMQQWIDYGARVKAVENIVRDLQYDLVCRAHPTYGKYAHDMLMAFGKAKSKLDDIVCSEYPDWQSATHVFYGSVKPVL